MYTANILLVLLTLGLTIIGAIVEAQTRHRLRDQCAARGLAAAHYQCVARDQDNQ